MEIFLDTWVSRVGTAELLTAEPTYKPNILIRGLANLPVRFQA
ncbi:hypothetical protein FDG2_0631 [Candidatus Protofrankia californiensis]|uniref:Uncharacterized protein n=2 Tax=Protofrankia TaxID=2994361 RepID=A0A1C3NTY5_9ACTN|nr:hypothetical protein FDG2_0631 [Candidatus Protofrankia californiensis]